MRGKLHAVVLLALILVTEVLFGQAEANASEAVRGAKAKSAFERLKGLSGEWRGKSTKGWTEKIEYDVIAGGSVLMERSFGAHPNEWMTTMIHMDGDRLLLTHYCIAQNQPRLVATNITDDGSQITFEYLDATNLKSRDQGHMDKVVFKLSTNDRFTAKWSWYQDGKENWMEEIEHRREAKNVPAPATGKLSLPCCGEPNSTKPASIRNARR